LSRETRIGAPHSSVFARLASGAFYETIVLLTFYEIIKYEGPWKRAGGVAFLRSPQAFAVAPLPNFPAGGSSSRTIDLGNLPRAIRIAKNMQIR
jgi:hypothetical protein